MIISVAARDNFDVIFDVLMSLVKRGNRVSNKKREKAEEHIKKTTSSHRDRFSIQSPAYSTALNIIIDATLTSIS